MIFSMQRIIQHSYNFYSSRTPKPKLRIINPKLLIAKLEGTETNPRPRIRLFDKNTLSKATAQLGQNLSDTNSKMALWGQKYPNQCGQTVRGGYKKEITSTSFTFS